jgi:hypothetical protein
MGWFLMLEFVHIQKIKNTLKSLCYQIDNLVMKAFQLYDNSFKMLKMEIL